MRRLSIAVLAAGLLACASASGADAQVLPSGDASEEALLRAELQRIIDEEPAQADAARKALDSLNQPAAGKAGRQMRNRRLLGARRIVNGLSTQGYPAVGALLNGADPRTATFQCTGTLVGCDKFLTAAHCIEGQPEGPYQVFLQDAGFVAVKEVLWRKDEYNFPYFDLAMLTLERPVEGIAPMPINTSVKPLNKSPATIVGFGRTGGARYDYGIKREGSVRTAACPASHANWKVLCWAFDADVVSRPSRSNTCNGDSGGGVFMLDKDQQRTVDKVFGVVSGGRAANCSTNDVSYNVDVFQFREWIEKAGEGRLTSRMCGSPNSERRDADAIKLLIKFDHTHDEWAQAIEVPAGIQTLFVSMNADDNGKGRNDFDLALFHGDPQAGSTPVCSEDGSGVFAVCSIAVPASGLWTIVVRRKKGAGNVQVTARFLERSNR